MNLTAVLRSWAAHNRNAAGALVGAALPGFAMDRGGGELPCNARWCLRGGVAVGAGNFFQVDLAQWPYEPALGAQRPGCGCRQLRQPGVILQEHRGRTGAPGRGLVNSRGEVFNGEGARWTRDGAAAPAMAANRQASAECWTDASAAGAGVPSPLGLAWAGAESAAAGRQAAWRALVVWRRTPREAAATHAALPVRTAALRNTRAAAWMRWSRQI